MPEPTEPAPALIEREATALTTLEEPAAERSGAEAETEKAFRARREEEERVFQAHKNRVTSTARIDTQETKAKYQATKDQATQAAESETKAVEAEYAEAKRKAVA